MAAPGKTPKRVGFLYVPNGIVHDAWKPVAPGRDYELPYSLEALRPIKDDVTVLTGLSQIPYGEKKGVGHAQPTAALLTGAVADKEKIVAGQSVDQISHLLRQRTRQRQRPHAIRSASASRRPRGRGAGERPTHQTPARHAAQ